MARSARSRMSALPRSVRLEDLSWKEAEGVLKPQSVVLIPLGAAAKEHGYHLPLSTDAIQAEYLTRAVARRTPVVVAPLIPCHYYPAFAEYPGSISLRRSTAEALVIDIVSSVAAFGPRRFYVLNTGISTVAPLANSAKALSRRGIILHFTDLAGGDRSASKIATQPGGSHADESETSRMLRIAPGRVNMDLAIDEFDPDAPPGGLTRKATRRGAYSASGVWGYPRLATARKGKALLELLIGQIVADIENLRRLRV